MGKSTDYCDYGFIGQSKFQCAQRRSKKRIIRLLRSLEMKIGIGRLDDLIYRY